MKVSIANGAAKVALSVAGVAGSLVYAPRTTSPIEPIAADAEMTRRNGTMFMARPAARPISCVVCGFGNATYGYAHKTVAQSNVVVEHLYVPYCFEHAAEREYEFAPGSFRRLLGR